MKKDIKKRGLKKDLKPSKPKKININKRVYNLAKRLEQGRG